MASTHGKYVNGASVFWSSREDKWLDAIGENVVKYFNDFTDPALDSELLAGWTNTAVEAGTGSSTHIAKTADGTIGVLRWDAAANENDGLQSQLNGTYFKLEDDKPLYFGARWAITEKTQSDAFIGLAAVDTTIIAGCDDYIGFKTDDGDANLDIVHDKNGAGPTAADTGEDLVDGTFVTTEFYFDGDGTVKFYVDGELTNTVTSVIPDDVYLRLSIAYLNGAGTMQHDGVDVDWVRVIQCK